MQISKIPFMALVTGMTRAQCYLIPNKMMIESLSLFAAAFEQNFDRLVCNTNISTPNDVYIC